MLHFSGYIKPPLEHYLRVKQYQAFIVYKEVEILSELAIKLFAVTVGKGFVSLYEQPFIVILSLCSFVEDSFFRNTLLPIR